MPKQESRVPGQKCPKKSHLPSLPSLPSFTLSKTPEPSTLQNPQDETSDDKKPILNTRRVPDQTQKAAQNLKLRRRHKTKLQLELYQDLRMAAEQPKSQEKDNKTSKPMHRKNEENDSDFQDNESAPSKKEVKGSQQIRGPGKLKKRHEDADDDELGE